MVELKICSGTLCYIMGGADICEIERFLSDNIKDRVDIKASPCLGHCKDTINVKPPCVEINNKRITEATIDKIVREIQREEEK